MRQGGLELSRGQCQAALVVPIVILQPGRVELHHQQRDPARQAHLHAEVAREIGLVQDRALDRARWPL
jgi:hypothetical protein